MGTIKRGKQQPSFSPIPGPEGLVKGNPRVEEFNRLIFNEGYEILWEKALHCPNVMNTGLRGGITDELQPVNRGRFGEHDAGCTLCDGHKWVYTDPQRSHAYISSVTMQKNYFLVDGRWDYGTAQVTPLSDVRLNYWDRITLLNTTTTYSQPVVRSNQGEDNLRYPAKKLLKVIKVIRRVEKFGKDQLIDVTDKARLNSYGNIEWLSDDVKRGQVYTALYEYNPVYIITELNHRFRDYFYKFKQKEGKVTQFPMNAVMKLDFIVFPDEGDRSRGIPDVQDTGTETFEETRSLNDEG